MNQRRLWLTRLLKLLALCGLGFAAYPFFATLLPDAGVTDQRRAQWEREIDISSLPAGELMNIEGWPGGPIAVYHRLPHEHAGLEQESQLHDPASLRSHQPDALRTATRSLLADYFVFIPLDTERGCQIRYIPPNKQPKPDIEWYGGFSEPCNGSLYDTAGRIYRDARGERQQNLKVPDYKIVGRQQLQLNVQTSLGR